MTAGTAMCSDCRPGEYSNLAAVSCLKCDFGTYSNSSGQSSCTPCSYGLVATTRGSTHCDPCPAHYAYSGPAACSLVPETSALDELVTAHGAPFYVVAVFALACGALPLLINNTKKNKPHLLQMSLIGALVQFVLCGGGFMFEIALGIVLIVGKTYVAQGTVILLSRLFHVIPTLLMAALMFSHDSSTEASSSTPITHFEAFSTRLLNFLPLLPSHMKFLDAVHFFENSHVFVVCFILCLFECSLLRHLPWRLSAFSKVCGFPSIFMLKTTLTASMLQKVSVVACQISLLVDLNQNVSDVAKTFLYINVSISVILLFMGLVESGLKMLLLSGDDLTDDPDDTRQSRRSTATHDSTSDAAFATIGDVRSEIKRQLENIASKKDNPIKPYTQNPMISRLFQESGSSKGILAISNSTKRLPASTSSITDVIPPAPETDDDGL